MEDFSLPFTVIFTLMFFFVQRSEPKARGCVMWFLILAVGGIVLWFSSPRGVTNQAISAFFTALFLNFVFWVLIGRYNPVKSSDDIQVLGMDD